MTENTTATALSSRLVGILPYLRRYARALAGNQPLGDEYALAALQAVLDDTSVIDTASSVKVGLYRVFFGIWGHEGQPAPVADGEAIAQAHEYLHKLTPHSRHALLLHAIEEFKTDQIAEIMDTTAARVDDLIATARVEMKSAITGQVMVIEDEAMIAMDLQDIVVGMGHSVTGAAATRAQAVELARAAKPDLILSDIQLADGSSGIDAADEILQAAAGIPVIFITAFPERLLTGERSEPAFVITKPYGEEQVQSAVSQAMFFRSSRNIAI